MKLVFAGTPDFAVPSLRALVAAGHDIALVLTQPDRPSGRGRQPASSPVKQFALEHGLRVDQPASLKEYREPLANIGPDAMIVVAYGLLLPPAVLALPKFGCINVHASLLPRWRGAAPIARAVEAGDTVTGITIMQMERGLDTGPMLAKVEVPVDETATAASLHDKLAQIGGDLLVATLPGIADGSVQGQRQDDAKATYASKLSKEEGRLDWNESAITLARKVRAFNPRPVAYAFLNNETVRIWFTEAVAAKASGEPGTIVRADADGLLVATGEGALLIKELQPPGGKRLGARAFLNGRPVRAGDRFT